jgi:hypothetical protein
MARAAAGMSARVGFTKPIPTTAAISGIAANVGVREERIIINSVLFFADVRLGASSSPQIRHDASDMYSEPC